MHTFNPSAWEAEARGSQYVPGQPELLGGTNETNKPKTKTQSNNKRISTRMQAVP